jgi:hypothetical protein
LRRGQLLVSFQRYAWPPGDVVDQAPSSLGALPVAWGRSEFLLPLAHAEAFWIGSTLPSRLQDGSVSLELLDGNGRCALTARLDDRDTTIIAGVRREDGRFDVFCGSSVARVRVHVGAQSVEVRLADYDSFAAETRCAPPEPLDPTAGYGGWRLP